MPVLLVGRTMQGAAAGTLMTMTFVSLTALVSLRERGKWVGLISLVWLVGSLVGPILGGVFSQEVTWVRYEPESSRSKILIILMQRWNFWITLPFTAISAVIVIFFLRIDGKMKPPRDIVKAVDWIGSFVFISSLTSFLIPLSWVCYPISTNPPTQSKADLISK